MKIQPKDPSSWIEYLPSLNTIPGIMLYSLVCYIVMLLSQRFIAPWLEKLDQKSEDDFKKRIIDRREQKGKEAEALLRKQNIMTSVPKVKKEFTNDDVAESKKKI